ncbi:MAG: hypothetical protein IPM39_06505 [Chloroflexi bacterium]|nr:hypothetical protein [Chloroflexota bacterium]
MAQVTNGSNHATQHSPDKLNEMRFLARSVGLLALLTGLIYLRVIGSESFLTTSSRPGNDHGLLLFALVAAATLGILCAWRWEAVGGIVASVSALGIALLAYFTFPEQRWFAAFAYSSPFLVTGLLFLGCWQSNRHPA